MGGYIPVYAGSVSVSAFDMRRGRRGGGEGGGQGVALEWRGWSNLPQILSILSTFRPIQNVLSLLCPVLSFSSHDSVLFSAWLAIFTMTVLL